MNGISKNFGKLQIQPPKTSQIIIDAHRWLNSINYYNTEIIGWISLNQLKCTQ